MGPHATSNTLTVYQNPHSSAVTSNIEHSKLSLNPNFTSMKQVINHAISLELVDSTNIIDIHDNLSSAIKNSNIEKFRFWISKLRDVNQSIDLFTGRTALHIAALYKQKLMIHLLKQKDAFLTVRDRDNQTPLDLAIAAHPDNHELQDALNPNLKCQSNLFSITE